MKLAVTVGVSFLLLLGFGSADDAKPQPEKKGIPKDVEEWHYPKAAVVGQSSSDRLYQAVLTTEDGLDKVFAHYDKKCGTSLAGDCPPGIFDTATDFADGKRKTTLSADDTTIPVATRQKGDPRGVTLRQLTRDEPGFFVTVLVTRTKDDTKTHLLITYLKK